MNNKKVTSVFVFIMSLVVILSIFALPASAATSISKATISYTTSYEYTGEAIKPKVTVKVGSKKLTTKSYSVSYKNNKSVGKGTITIKGKGSYNGTVTKSFYIKPKATSSLKATGYSTKVKLSWKKVTGAKGYQVYQQVDGKWKKVITTSKTSYTVTGLDSATTYKFRVRPYAKAGSKSLYGSFKYVTKSTTIGKVTDIDFSSITGSSAKLSWDKIPAATSYRVTYTDTDNNFKRTVTTETNSISLSSLSAGKEYKITIRAYNRKKDILGNASDAFYFKTAPTPVKSLKAEAVSSTGFKLTWDKVAGADAYQIWINKCDKNGNETSYTKYGNTKNTYCVLENLSPCTYYNFRVRAYEKTTAGTVYSSYVYTGKVFTPVSVVSSFSSGAVTADSAVFTWTRPVNVDGYKLYVNGTLKETLPATTTSYTLRGLEKGKNYTVAIAAYFGSYEGEKTEVKITTGDTAVKSIEFINKPSVIKPGDTATVTVTVLPAEATDKSVIFTSSNEATATIDESGKITALKTGFATITVTSKANPSVKASFLLSVKNVEATSISLPANITITQGELVTLPVAFTPADVTDKTFTVTGQDHTYTYREFISQKTDICLFSDYISVSSTGSIKGLKVTTEPKTGNTFSFNVTVKTTDGSNKTATTKITVVPRMLDIYYEGAEDYPWYFGNTVALSYSFDDSIAEDYSGSDLRFKSSDTSVATVTNEGIVTCKNEGDVTITATTSDNKYKATYSAYVKNAIVIEDSFFDGCKAGQTYQIKAQLKPATDTDHIVYYSSDNNILTVTNSGLVTFKKSGDARVFVGTASDYNSYKSVWFTSDTISAPSGSTSQLLSKMKTTANSVKSLSALPSVTRYDITTTDNFKVSSDKISADQLMSMFRKALSPKTTFSPAVASSAANYTDLKKNFLSSIPVSGQSYIIASGLSDSDVRSITVEDNGDYYYDMKLTLKEESFSSLPSSAASTRHGKVFDILTNSYINSYLETINNSGKGMSISYSGFATRYHDCTLTIRVNKATGNLEKAIFDMTVDVNVDSLKMTYMGMGETMDVSFTCNNVVNISFSGYQS